MSKVIRLFRGVVFDPEAAKVLGEAYDSAIRSLSGTRPIENAEELIAQWIVWLAQQGERDVERLRKSALRRLEREARAAEIQQHREFLRKIFASPNAISLRISASQKRISESMELLDRVSRQF